ncbi:alpha/beta fold hydrolase [Acinetobacter sp. ANC 5579]|uniref:alpha/beta fold hydrolase n=1 Tax=Acinetobacter amyesii TaxID=2942470 RepID=UPI0020BF6A8A|nr:alpha/beta fold hydrolase [Acinetobacter amyesii]MCL6233888.1 alpha/beta fold hydrolase [Acinetobacter amyesii]
MILNYEYHQKLEGETYPLVFIHGLFGSLSNLGMLARAFQNSHSVIQLDLRNHGKSPQSTEMNYREMANDVLETLDAIGIDKFSVIGHSMGGKVAMQLALISERVEQLVVLDIAPFAYQERHHDEIFKALIAVNNAQIQSRQEAVEIMREYIHSDMVIQFLLKSFSKGQWLFNVDALYQQYDQIIGWENIGNIWQQPVLFLKGGESPYISKAEHTKAIEHQFPQAKIVEVEGAGHWLHAEKTAKVVEEIQNYLE